MNILNISTYDLAGVGYKIHEAINRYGHGWHSNHIALHTHAMHYPIEYLVNDNTISEKKIKRSDTHEKYVTMDNRKEIRRLLNNADIIQFNHTTTVDKILGYPIPKDKIMGVYHTGTEYRRNTEAVNERLKHFDRTFVTYETNLMEACPYAHVLRRPIDTELYKPSPKKHKNSIIISHSPSHEDKKGTKYLREAYQRLEQEFDNVELQIIKDVTWAKVMKLKNEADIFFDMLPWKPNGQTYGLSGLEAACFGVPVLTGKKYSPECTFVHVTKETLYAEIKNMILYPKHRKILGEMARDYVEKYHSYEAIAKSLIASYEELIK